MKKNLRRSALGAKLAGLLVLFNLATASADKLLPGVNLFFIKRSLNHNEVHFDAVVDLDGCTWQKPYVVSYWRDLKEGDHVYSKIRWWEHRAYGFRVFALDDKTVDIRLRALESANIDRPVIARLTTNNNSCQVTTAMTLQDGEAELQSVYIKVTDSMIPGYDYFDILGYRKGRYGSKLESDRVSERFQKNEKEIFNTPPMPLHWQSGVIERGLEMGRPPRMN